MNLVNVYSVKCACLLAICMHVMTSCMPQIGSEDEDEVPVTQFARGARVDILAHPAGVVVGSICVLDAQPTIPPGWNNPDTKLGDYISVSYNTAKTTRAAKNHVAELDNWTHYLRLDWTRYTKKNEDDDDIDDEADEPEGGWEMTLRDIIDEGFDFLVYREFLSLHTPKPQKKSPPSASWAPTWPPKAALRHPSPRARQHARQGQQAQVTAQALVERPFLTAFRAYVHAQVYMEGYM